MRRAVFVSCCSSLIQRQWPQAISRPDQAAAGAAYASTRHMAGWTRRRASTPRQRQPGSTAQTGCQQKERKNASPKLAGTATTPATPRRGATRHASGACRTKKNGNGDDETCEGCEGGERDANARVRGRTDRRKSWTRWLRAAARPAHEPVSPHYAANTLLRILHSAAGDRHHFRPAPGSIRTPRVTPPRDNPYHQARGHQTARAECTPRRKPAPHSAARHTDRVTTRALPSGRYPAASLRFRAHRHAQAQVGAQGIAFIFFAEQAAPAQFRQYIGDEFGQAAG